MFLWIVLLYKKSCWKGTMFFVQRLNHAANKFFAYFSFTAYYYGKACLRFAVGAPVAA